jgi:hypothetical protein
MLIPYTGSLTDDVYKLTIDDIKEITKSDQVGSKIYLTMPLYMSIALFITMTVTNKLGLQFSGKRDHPQWTS